MRDFRSVLQICGASLSGFAGIAAIMALLSGAVWQDAHAPAFLACALASGFFGGLFLMLAHGAPGELDFRMAVAVTAGAWLGLPVFAAIPFIIGPHPITLTDAVFETISGLTTTGATVLVSIEDTVPSLLFWRALLQWIGGIGIIALSIAILPFLRVGGMQLFHLESSDRSTERLIARPGDLALTIGALYLVMTLLCLLGYGLAGMTGFEAVTHALTTVSTGGYGTRTSSFGEFSSGAQWIAIIFMIAAALPFLAYVRLLRAHQRSLQAYTEIWVFLGLIVVVTALVVILRGLAGEDAAASVRTSLFNVVSVITTTGFAASDYTSWGGFAVVIVFFLTFVGGCAGSTAGGFKIFRIEILARAIGRSLSQLPMPRSVVTARHQGRRLSNGDIASVALFAAVYVATFVIAAIALSATGLDPMTALSGAATALANVGPGLGDVIGPAGDFTSLPDVAKWLLCAVMLMGRLEILVVLLLFTPRFWSQ